MICVSKDKLSKNIIFFPLSSFHVSAFSLTLARFYSFLPFLFFLQCSKIWQVISKYVFLKLLLVGQTKALFFLATVPHHVKISNLVFSINSHLPSQMLLHHPFSKRNVSVKITLYENNDKNGNGKSSFSNINNFSWQKNLSPICLFDFGNDFMVIFLYCVIRCCNEWWQLGNKN